MSPAINQISVSRPLFMFKFKQNALIDIGSKLDDAKFDCKECNIKVLGKKNLFVCKSEFSIF